MSKFKNKKALALAISAAMAGVGIVGVAAACAPTKQKTKPTKRKEGSSSSSGSTNPGTSSGTNTNPGTGSAGTQGSNQTTPVAPTNPESGNGSNTNPGSQTQINKPTTPDLGSSNPQNSKGIDSNSINSQEEAKKAQEEAEKQKLAEQEATKKAEKDKKSLEEKKTQVKTELTKLTDLKKEELTQFNSKVDGIVDPAKITDLEQVLANAKAKNEENKKANALALENKKIEAKKQIEGLKHIPKNNKEAYKNQIDKITSLEQGDEINKIVQNAKEADSAKEQADKIKNQLTPVSLTIDNSKYFWLELKASEETYNKIRDKRLKFNLDTVNGESIEFAAEFKVGEKIVYHQYIRKEQDNIIFKISSNLPYGADNEKGTYKVTKVWLSDDKTETNLLKSNSNEVNVK